MEHLAEVTLITEVVLDCCFSNPLCLTSHSALWRRTAGGDAIVSFRAETPACCVQVTGCGVEHFYARELSSHAHAMGVACFNSFQGDSIRTQIICLSITSLGLDLMTPDYYRKDRSHRSYQAVNSNGLAQYPVMHISFPSLSVLCQMSTESLYEYASVWICWHNCKCLSHLAGDFIPSQLFSPTYHLSVAFMRNI